MTVEFPRRRQAKRAGELPCTTRTIASVDHGLANVWELAEASLHTELSHDVLAEASAIEMAERSRTLMGESLGAGKVPVTVSCQGAGTLTGQVIEHGENWVLIRRERLLLTGVQMSSVLRIAGVQHRLATEVTEATGLRSWSQWLRSLIDQEVGHVQMTLIDGWTALVAIGFVGSDFARVSDDDGNHIDVMIRSMSTITIGSMRLTD